MRVTLTILLLLAFFLQSDAQDSTRTKFYISPGHPSFLRIDGNILYKLDTMTYPYKIDVAVGAHEIEVWSPKYKLHKENILIKPDTLNQIVITMNNVLEEQKHYKKKTTEFKLRRIGRVSSLVAIATSDILWTFRQLDKLESQETATNITYNRVLEAKAKYESTISTTAYVGYRSQYNQLNDRYKAEQEEYKTLRNRTILVNTGSALIIGGAIVAFTKFKLNKPVAPVFENPFLSSTSLYFSPSSVGLTLKF